MENEACPCMYSNINPCHEMCACRNKFSSVACIRCCSQGNRKQRQMKAEYLSDVIEVGMKYVLVGSDGQSYINDDKHEY